MDNLESVVSGLARYVFDVSPHSKNLNKEMLVSLFKVVVKEEGFIGHCGMDSARMLSDVEIAKRGDSTFISDLVLLNCFCVMKLDKDRENKFSSPSSIKIGEKMGVSKFSQVEEKDFIIHVASKVGYTLPTGFVTDAEDEEEDSIEDVWEDEGEWGTDDIEESTSEEDILGNEEIKEVVDVGDKKEEGLSEEEDLLDVGDFYSQLYEGAVNNILTRFDSLYMSGFELTKPDGVLSSNTIVSVEADGKKSLPRSLDTQALYKLLQERVGFIEKKSRLLGSISEDIKEGYKDGKKLLYFPNKILEFSYGTFSLDEDLARNLKEESSESSGFEKNYLGVYKMHPDAYNWSNYRDYITKGLVALVRISLNKFAKDECSRTGLSYDSENVVNEVRNFINYLSECMCLSFLLVDYKKSKSNLGGMSMVKLCLRVCDIRSKLESSLLSSIIKQCFGGNKGKVPMSYPVREVPEVFLKEYTHEFNHDVSQASPLFAYQAYRKLKKQGKKPTWDNLILGLGEDGSIIKNGSEISFFNALAHFNVGGSRSGKGVMTQNSMIGAIVSYKALFYIDRKPDISSMLRALSKLMFIVNGGNYQSGYDFYGGETGIIGKDIESASLENIPDYVLKALNLSSKDWNVLGDIFYMRALMLIVGIIIARASSVSEDTLQKLGGKRGIVLVIDEITQFNEGFTSVLMRLGQHIPPKAYDTDLAAVRKEAREIREKVEKGKISEEDASQELFKAGRFDTCYSKENFFSLSLIKSFLKSLSFVNMKRDAGFDNVEVGRSDIFVIGQGADEFSISGSAGINEVEKSRYASMTSQSQSGFMSNPLTLKSKDGSLSIPYSILTFRPCDAFFGRNSGTRGGYLALGDEGSRAYGRLDDKASNFLYIPSYTEQVRSTIFSQNRIENIRIANDKNNKYFKPFLTLNSDEPKYVDGMFERCKAGGVMPEEIVAANCDDKDPTKLNSAVGFVGALRDIGVEDYEARLDKSGEIADYVVKRMGYAGGWFDFITDLRPTWLFTIEDVVNCLTNQPMPLNNPESNDVLMEFYKAFPSIFGSGFVGGSGEEVSVAEEFAREAFGDIYNQEELDEKIRDTELKSIFGDFYENPGGSDTLEDEDDLFSEEGWGNVSEDQQDEEDFRGQEEFVNENTFFEDDSFRDKFQKLSEFAENLGINLNALLKGRSGIPVDNFGEGVYTNGKGERCQFNDLELSLPMEGVTDEVLMAKLSENIISSIGVNNIRTVEVVGNALIINNQCVQYSGLDLKNSNLSVYFKDRLLSGNIATIFNYKILRSCKNLGELSFDSMDFAFNWFSYGVGYEGSIDLGRVFRDFSIRTFIVGKKMFHKDSWELEAKNDTDYYNPGLARKLTNIADDYLSSVWSKPFRWVGNTWKDSERSLGLKFAVTAVGTVTGGTAVAASVGVKIAKKGVSGISRLADSLKGALGRGYYDD